MNCSDYEDGSAGPTAQCKVIKDVPPVPLVPVIKKWEHNLKIKGYTAKRKAFREKTKIW